MPFFSDKKGFTLIELLVVIAIIGLLSSVVLVSMQGVRAKARDAVRKRDLQQIVKAFELYYFDHGTYIIPNSGYGSCSCGWFNYEGGPYVRSIARALKEEGYVGGIIIDPTGGATSSPTSGYAYMKYQCGTGFFVYAKLEKPTAQDLATCDASSCCPGYGMNYAVGHR
ncbi:MAG: type II secretion system protein [Candidatus Nealsonbacteria bacterium]